MRTDATSTIRSRNSRQSNDLHQTARVLKRITFRSPEWRHSWLHLLTATTSNQELVPQGQIVKCHETVLKHLLLRCRHVCQKVYKNENWSSLQDNALPLIAIRARNFFPQHCVTVIPHPPYSLDLEPADFFLFLHLEKVIKGTRFADISDIWQRAMSVHC